MLDVKTDAMVRLDGDLMSAVRPTCYSRSEPNPCVILWL